MSETVVPLGSLAIVFAVISFLVLIRKSAIARQADESVKNKFEAKRNEKESLDEQKKRLELLLKK